MSKGLIFYLVFFVWILIGLVPWRKEDRAGITLRGFGSDLIIAILLLLLAWSEYGPPIK